MTRKRRGSAGRTTTARMARQIKRGSELALASAEVIAQRTPLLAQAMADPRLAGDPELLRMASEKMLAMWEAGVAMAGIWTRASTPRGMLTLWSAALTPFHRRATANARRLRRG